MIVTCRKCKKIFDTTPTMGICPKCGRYYSTTSYNEEEKYLDNILASSNEKNCSYHNNDYTHKHSSISGHDEYSHKLDENYLNKHSYEQMSLNLDNSRNRQLSLEEQKEQIAQKLRDKYSNGGYQENFNKQELYRQTKNAKYNVNLQTNKGNNSPENAKKITIIIIFISIFFIQFCCLFM